MVARAPLTVFPCFVSWSASTLLFSTKLRRGPEALESTGLRRCRSAVIAHFKPTYIDEEREKEKKRRLNGGGGGGKREGAQPHDRLSGLPLALGPAPSPSPPPPPSSALSNLPSAPPSSPIAGEAGVAASLGGGGEEDGVPPPPPPPSNGSLANGDHAGAGAGGGGGADEVGVREACLVCFFLSFRWVRFEFDAGPAGGGRVFGWMSFARVGLGRVGFGLS